MHFNEISDEEWLQLAPVLSDAAIVHGRRGRPRAQVRVVANAVPSGSSREMRAGHTPEVNPQARAEYERTFQQWLRDVGWRS